MEQLCERYWRPAYSYMRRKGQPPERAEDLTQDFFTRLIEKGGFTGLDRERGRFRNFVVVALDRFLVNNYHYERALKRGGAFRIESLEFQNAEASYQRQPFHNLTPERLFDRHWALAILDQALGRLRLSSRLAEFDRFMPFLVADSDRGGYEQLAHALGSTTSAVKVSVHRLRKRYREALREEIFQTVECSEDVEAELQYLLRTLRDG